MNSLLSRIEIYDEPGVILARQQARTIAEALGFWTRDRLVIASVVTHAACEAVRHAGGARLEFLLDQPDAAAPSLLIQVVDHASTDHDLMPGPSRDYEPANRWMDRFDVDAAGGRPTTVTMSLRLPERSLPIDPALAGQIAEKLLEFHPHSAIGEILDQDLALFRSFDEIGDQKTELSRLNSEQQESRRAIQTLHAELAEQAESLRTGNDLKTRFLSRVSHELRTPLASILGLARLLLDRADGNLTVEQERQVSFIVRAAHDLSGLVNDLLDLARLEAGREVLQVSEVDIAELFSSLQGLFRSLLPSSSPVALIFEKPNDLPKLCTDRAKLAQVLRNFLSNSLKFTETGEIRVEAQAGADDTIVFSVTDTGLGIAPEDLEWVFEEFAQVEIPQQHQHPTKGTGLGLPMARKLALVLGGRVDVQSDPGVGSTFTATIPIHLPGQSAPDANDCVIP